MIHHSMGTPTWVELCSPDVEVSVAFYHELFGWEASEEKRSSGSWLFSSGDKIVAGIRPLHSTHLSSQWISYVSTDNAGQTVSRAKAAGAKVLLETGRDEAMGMSMLQDPEGAIFGAFQSDQFGGAQVFNQPISLTFNLLMTRQPQAAKSFYSAIFGWEPRDRTIGGMVFTYFFQGVRGVAGLMAMNERWPQSAPAHWQVSFSVDDAEALAAQAVELGGKASPVTASPFGRSALITDPHGATFSISQQTPEVRAAARTPEGVLAHLI